jgi:hypothetical protein
MINRGRPPIAISEKGKVQCCSYSLDLAAFFKEQRSMTNEQSS